MTRTTLHWIAAIAVATASGARADPRRDPAPAAKPFVDAGIAAYSAGDYETAVKEFSAAYKIDPQPAILYAWAQALRLGNRCADAIPMYRRYLATDVNEAQRGAAQNGISLCEQVQPVEPDKPEPDKPEPDKPEPDKPDPEKPPADKPELTATSDEPRPRRWYADPIGGGLVIGGAISIGVGAGFLVRSSQNRGAADEATFRDDFIELLDTATQQRRIGVVGLCVGAALVTGGVLWYVSRRDQPRAVEVAITGRSFVLRGRF